MLSFADSDQQSCLQGRKKHVCVFTHDIRYCGVVISMKPYIPPCGVVEVVIIGGPAPASVIVLTLNV